MRLECLECFSEREVLHFPFTRTMRQYSSHTAVPIIVAMAAPITPITMIGGVVPHDQIDKLLQVVFAITEYTYDVIVCYDGKCRYAAHKTENGMECQVFGTAK